MKGGHVVGESVLRLGNCLSCQEPRANSQDGPIGAGITVASIRTARPTLILAHAAHEPGEMFQVCLTRFGGWITALAFSLYYLTWYLIYNTTFEGTMQQIFTSIIDGTPPSRSTPLSILFGTDSYS